MYKNAKEMGYKIDFAKRTITITKAFAENANSPTSKEFKLLSVVLAQFPDFQVIGRTHKSPKKPNKNKSLTYKNMETYISVFDNADELTADFYSVKDLSKAQPSRYHYVRDWFVKQFPDYKNIPVKNDGTLIAEPILCTAA